MVCGEERKYREYVQIHEKTTNTMHARTVSAIYLRSSGNTHGSFYFHRLWMDRRLHKKHRTSLPISQGVIDNIEELRRPGLYKAKKNNLRTRG